MQYTHTLTLSLPAAMLPIASAIARALDPDVGGYASWTDNGDTITTTTACTEAFAAQAQAMLADPALLHGAVVADYAARWADMTPPTLAECEQFCQEAML